MNEDQNSPENLRHDVDATSELLDRINEEDVKPLLKRVAELEKKNAELGKALTDAAKALGALHNLLVRNQSGGCLIQGAVYPDSEEARLVKLIDNHVAGLNAFSGYRG